MNGCINTFLEECGVKSVILQLVALEPNEMIFQLLVHGTLTLEDQVLSPIIEFTLLSWIKASTCMMLSTTKHNTDVLNL